HVAPKGKWGWGPTRSVVGGGPHCDSFAMGGGAGDSPSNEKRRASFRFRSTSLRRASGAGAPRAASWEGVPIANHSQWGEGLATAPPTKRGARAFASDPRRSEGQVGLGPHAQRRGRGSPLRIIRNGGRGWRH